MSPDRRVLILQHHPLAAPGWLGEALEAAGVAIDVVHLLAGQPVPERIDAHAVVSLGGDMSAYEEDAYPWLVEEKALLDRAVADEVPVLGICLGAQILADALGGQAHPAAAPEIGFLELDLTNQGRTDPVLRELRGPVLEWHADTFVPPPDATLLATSPRHPQAFRMGSALAVQFHPETSPAMLEGWVDALGRDEPGSPSAVPRTLAEDGRRHGPTLHRTAQRLFGAWIIDVGLARPPSGRRSPG